MANELAMIRQVAFGEDGVGLFVVGKPELEEGLYALSDAFTSNLGQRYKLVKGKVADAYKGKTDDEVYALLAAKEAADAAELSASKAQSVGTLSQLAFMTLFTDDELEAVYGAAKQSVAVEVFLDKLKLAKEVDLRDPRTVSGLDKLVASEILTAERAADIKAGKPPVVAAA